MKSGDNHNLLVLKYLYFHGKFHVTKHYERDPNILALPSYVHAVVNKRLSYGGRQGLAKIVL